MPSTQTTPVFPQPIPAFWTFFGHSYYQGAYGTHSGAGRADSIIRNLFGLAQVQYTKDHAKIGAKLTFSGNQQGGWTRLVQNVRGQPGPNISAPDVATDGSFFLGWGINDIGMSGNTVQCNTAYQHAMRMAISRCRCSRTWDPASASFTYGTGFSAVNFQWEQCSGDTYYTASSTTNATISWPLPADYAGGTVTFMFLAQAGVLGATFSFGGTAGVTGTVSTSGIMPAAFVTGRSPVVKRITGLSAANAGQTITVTVTAIDAGGSADFGGVWIESPWPPPVLVANTPRLNPPIAGYQQTLTASGLSGTAVSSTPATITLASGTTDGIATAGTVTMPSAGGTVTITYTGKTSTTLTGCTAAGGSGNYSSNTMTSPGPVDADIWTFNSYLTTLVENEFSDGMVQIVDLDHAISKDPVALGTDGIHPSELGAARIADAFYAAYQNLTPTSTYGEASQMNVPNRAQVPLFIPHLSGSWYTTPNGGAGPAYTPVAGDMFALPFTCTQQNEVWFQWSVQTLGGSAACTVEMGVFDDRSMKGIPQYLLTNACTSPISLPTGAAVFNSTGSAGNGFLNVQPEPGLYWLILLICTTGTGVTLQTVQGPNYLMPNTGLTTGGLGNPAGFVGFKETGQGTTIPTNWSFMNDPGLLTQVTSAPLIGIKMF